MNRRQPIDDTNDAPHAWRTSLAFWLSLLLAALLYASVALAPKLLVHATLSAEHAANRRELVSLERRMKRLERIRNALQSDPDYAAELARMEFDRASADEERISVEPLLSLDAPHLDVPTPAQRSAPPAPWHLPVLRVLAGNRRVRVSLLIVAAAIILWAFTFLHERDPSDRRRSDSSRWNPLGRLAARYRRDGEQNAAD